MIKNKYCVVHSTSIDNLLLILNDKVLYANKYISNKHMRLSGQERSRYVYMGIYDANSPNFGVALLFDPKILKDESFIFNYGWLATPTDTSIYVNKNDSIDINKKKLTTIFNYLSKTSKITDNEILFLGRILLCDYLIGVLCPNCDNTTIDKIRKIIDKEYKNVKIYTGNNFMN